MVITVGFAALRQQAMRRIKGWICRDQRKTKRLIAVVPALLVVAVCGVSEELQG